MAKPIEPTPELTGKDAQRFIENMIKKQTSPISQKEKALATAIVEFSRNRSPVI